MGVVYVKPSADLQGLQPAGIRILAAVDHCAQGLDVDLTITCGTDSHDINDPHTRGVALDIRTSDLLNAQIVKIHAFLTEMLGPSFTVLYETPSLPEAPELAAIAYVNKKATGQHYHIQLKRGTVTWPPVRMLA